MATVDRIIIEDCTFTELQTGSGAPAIQLGGTDGTQHSNVWIHRCTALDCGSNANTSAAGYGTFEVSGFTNVYIQNSAVRRSAIARGSSNMRGFTWKSINVVVEDCIADDIGTAGSNESFKHHEEAIFGTAVGNSSVRNCVAHNCKRGFRVTLVGATLTVTSSTIYMDTLGICAANFLFRQAAGANLTVQNCVLEGIGDGTAFESASATENHNDIFNVAAPGKTLDATDLTVDAVLSNPTIHDYRATAASVKTGASDGGTQGVRYVAGEAIIWAGV